MNKPELTEEQLTAIDILQSEISRLRDELGIISENLQKIIDSIREGQHNG
jgi:hypothetical protein